MRKLRRVVESNRIAKSLAMQARAKARIPGMTQLLSKRPDMFSEGVWPGYYSSAKGVEVWDLDGNSYIDMSIGGIGANILGYADPDVDQAVISAINRGVSSSLNCPEEVELADLLCDMHSWADMVRYTRAGGESMAMAVRIARVSTGKERIVFCGYHGWHDWYLAANLGDETALDGHLLPGLEPAGVPRALKGTAIPFQYGNLENLRQVMESLGQEVAAIVMEPVRNEDPSSEFLEGVRSLADDFGVVLIVDEISAGFRMNTGGAHLRLGLQPDLAVFSKALGNGYPIGAVIGKHQVMQAAQKTFISSTCWTERAGPVAAIATLKKHGENNVGSHLTYIGERVQEGWRRLFSKYDMRVTVRGIPPLSHFSFDYPEAQYLKAMFVELMGNQGFLASNLFYAMYAHSDEHVETYLDAMDTALARLKESLVLGTVSTDLSGKPSSTGFKRLT